jgi:hypothetical protein
VRQFRPGMAPRINQWNSWWQHGMCVLQTALEWRNQNPLGRRLTGDTCRTHPDKTLPCVGSGCDGSQNSDVGPKRLARLLCPTCQRRHPGRDLDAMSTGENGFLEIGTCRQVTKLN